MRRSVLILLLCGLLTWSMFGTCEPLSLHAQAGGPESVHSATLPPGSVSDHLTDDQPLGAGLSDLGFDAGTLLAHGIDRHPPRQRSPLLWPSRSANLPGRPGEAPLRPPRLA